MSKTIQPLLDFIVRKASVLSMATVAAVLVAGVAAAIASGDRLRFTDERSYDALANNIRAGNGFVNSDMTPTARRAPGYPFVLSIAYRVSCRPLTAKLLNAAAYACLALLLARLAGRIHPLCEVLAPLMLLLYPAGFYTACTLYPQTFGSLMLVGIVSVLYGQSTSLAKVALAGVLLGLLCLTIPSFLLVAPLFACCVFFSFGNRAIRSASATALFLFMAALALAPWTARNMRTFNAFIPVSSYSGVNLLLGNSENTGPNDGVNVDISRYRQMTRGMNEIQEDAAFRRYAIKWIAGNPRRAITLYAKKLANFFNYRNSLQARAEGTPARDFVMFATYYPLLALAAARVLLVRRQPMSPAEAAVAIVYLGNALLSAFFFTRIRFRIPFDALLTLPAASCVAFLISPTRPAGDAGAASPEGCRNNR